MFQMMLGGEGGCDVPYDVRGGGGLAKKNCFLRCKGGGGFSVRPPEKSGFADHTCSIIHIHMTLKLVPRCLRKLAAKVTR